MQEMLVGSLGGKILGGERGNPLQHSRMENSINRGIPWKATVHGVAKESDTTEQLEHACTPHASY